jgi:hypothetical protein
MISANRYKIIADLIDSAQSRGTPIAQYFSNMLETLSSSEMIEDSTDRQRLESQINTTLDVVDRYHQSYTRLMRNFVFALQKYVDDNYSTVDDFLSDNGIKVLPIFADISRVVGYPIADANIDTEDIS